SDSALGSACARARLFHLPARSVPARVGISPLPARSRHQPLLRLRPVDPNGARRHALRLHPRLPRQLADALRREDAQRARRGLSGVDGPARTALRLHPISVGVRIPRLAARPARSVLRAASSDSRKLPCVATDGAEAQPRPAVPLSRRVAERPAAPLLVLMVLVIFRRHPSPACS